MARVLEMTPFLEGLKAILDKNGITEMWSAGQWSGRKEVEKYLIVYAPDYVRKEIAEYIDPKIGDLYCCCFPMDNFLLDKAPKVYDGEHFYSAFC